MADVEQRAEAEAAHKGLSGGAAKAYVGGVFNRIRQAHSRGTQPGKGARHLQRRARVEARQEARNRIARHEQLGALEKLRMRMRTRQEEPRKTEPAKKRVSQFERDAQASFSQPDVYDAYGRGYQRRADGGLALVYTPEGVKPGPYQAIKADDSRAQPAPTPAQPAATGQAPAKKRVKYTPPRQDSWLRLQNDPTDPREALTRAGSHDALYEQLKDEPTGVLERMAERVSKHGRKPGRNDRAGWARYIVEGMKQPAPAPAQPAATKAAKPKRERMQQPPRLPKPLVPIKEMPIGFQLDATRKLDPYFIREYFGDKQLPRALDMQTNKNLREAVSVVEEKTGKKYSGPRTLTAMRAWILANM